ncbi:MAG: CoA-binding protein, partial [Phenylobacterium zucineum]
MKLAQAAHDFLGSTRIAVTGVSRNPQGHGSNTVYERLVERGYDAVPVNPHATEIAGRPCYPDLAAIPGGVQAVVIGTRPEYALRTVQDAVELGI